jgi:hypothetical protein
MSLETAVQNIAVEVRRRLVTARKNGNAMAGDKARNTAGKIAVGAWLLAGNLMRVAGGNRVGRQRVAIHSLQADLVPADEAQVLTTLENAVAAIHWQLVFARRSGSARRAEHLVADFVNATDSDLDRLSQALK